MSQSYPMMQPRHRGPTMQAWSFCINEIESRKELGGTYVVSSRRRPGRPRLMTIKLHEVAPIENAGRDTSARYEAQYRGAAYESLAILSGAIDRVYCDYHDDFVTRQLNNGQVRYCFYQVKTKEQPNYQWGRLDVFGIKKKGAQVPARYASSFAGKLLFHTVRFDDSCAGVVFLTNVHLDNDVQLAEKDLAASNFSNPVLAEILGLFNAAYATKGPYEAEAIKARLKKLSFRCGQSHLNPSDADFHALARDAIYRYSEIDLKHTESQQIVQSLLTLVRKKSFASLISEIDEKKLDDVAGVGLGDLLPILSISQSAFETLKQGGDDTALKTASILHRALRRAGAAPEMVEFCSRWKIEWDTWVRDKRHVLTEMDFAFLLEGLNQIKDDWVSGNVPLAQVQSRVLTHFDALKTRGQMAVTMTPELLFGGVLAALVRSEAL